MWYYVGDPLISFLVVFTCSIVACKWGSGDCMIALGLLSFLVGWLWINILDIPDPLKIIALCFLFGSMWIACGLRRNRRRNIESITPIRLHNKPKRDNGTDITSTSTSSSTADSEEFTTQEDKHTELRSLVETMTADTEDSAEYGMFKDEHKSADLLSTPLEIRQTFSDDSLKVPPLLIV